MSDTHSSSARHLVPEKLHSRILMLEVVTFLSLVLNLASCGSMRETLIPKVENTVMPSSAQTLR